MNEGGNGDLRISRMVLQSFSLAHSLDRHRTLRQGGA